MKIELFWQVIDATQAPTPKAQLKPNIDHVLMPFYACVNAALKEFQNKDQNMWLQLL